MSDDILLDDYQVSEKSMLAGRASSVSGYSQYRRLGLSANDRANSDRQEVRWGWSISGVKEGEKKATSGFSTGEFCLPVSTLNSSFFLPIGAGGQTGICPSLLSYPFQNGSNTPEVWSRDIQASVHRWLIDGRQQDRSPR